MFPCSLKVLFKERIKRAMDCKQSKRSTNIVECLYSTDWSSIITQVIFTSHAECFFGETVGRVKVQETSKSFQ